MTLYVLTQFLQVITSVVSGKCFGPFIITVVGFNLKILKNHFNFPKELVLGKNFVSVTVRNMLSYGLAIFLVQKCPSFNISLLKDKSVAKVFLTAFYKVESKLDFRRTNTFCFATIIVNHPRMGEKVSNFLMLL